jgi:hypothetical protein
MGVLGVSTANIVLQDCRVAAGTRGLALAEGAYARERRTFGKPLVDHQAIQFMMANAAIDIEASRHLVYYAASLVDQARYGEPGTFGHDPDPRRPPRAPAAWRGGSGAPGGGPSCTPWADPAPRHRPENDRR